VHSKSKLRYVDHLECPFPGGGNASRISRESRWDQRAAGKSLDNQKKARETLRQLEADLAHMNRLSMMGELSASLAHEINVCEKLGDFPLEW
jgi:hypothetical protein